MAQIKGITIPFSADTSKLDRAIKDVKKEARSVDAELRAVNKSLKFNPGNVELLAQKQTVLKQRVSETAKQLDLLNQRQAKMDAQGVDKNSTEYQQLRREIIETESKLKHFEDETRKLGDVKLTALSMQMEDVGKKMQTTGDALTKYITGPLAALGAASGAAWQGTQDALNTVTKLTGATGTDLENMQGMVTSIAKTVPADMDVIAQSVGEVNTRFGLTGDTLEDVSAEFVKFADINGLDITQAIDSTQKAMSAFGVSADDTGHVLDVLTRVSQNTGVSIDKLNAGLVSNSTAFQEMGLSMDESASLMGMLEKSGINMETATNGMRKALKSAAKDGRPVNEVLAELQDTIVNDKDGVEGLQKAYDVFGKSGDQMYGAIKSGAIDFKNLGVSADDAAGALDRTFDATRTPADDFKLIMNELKILGYEIANTVLPYVNGGMKKVAKVIETISKKWQKLPKGTQKRILAVAGAIALVGPALSIAGRALQGVAKVVRTVSTVIGGLSKAMAFLAANPVVLIIAGIVALVAAFVVLWKKSEAFRNFWIKLWNGVKKVAISVWTAIKNAFVTAWDAIKNVWNGAKAFFLAIWNGIKAVFSGVITFYRTIFTTAWTAVKTIWNTAKAFFLAVWNGIKAVFAGVVAFYRTIFTNAWTAIKTAWAGVTAFFSGIWAGIKSVFSGVAGWFGSIFSGAWSRIKSAFSGVGAFFGGIWSTIKNKFTGLGSSIASAFSGAFRYAINGVIGTIQSTINGAIGLINGAIGLINKIPGVSVGKVGRVYLPRMAKGGVLQGAQAVIAGEAGPEAIIPLDRLFKQMDKMAATMAGTGDGVTINVYAAPGMDPTAIAEAVERKLIESQKRRREAWA